MRLLVKLAPAFAVILSTPCLTATLHRMMLPSNNSTPAQTPDGISVSGSIVSPTLLLGRGGQDGHLLFPCSTVIRTSSKTALLSCSLHKLAITLRRHPPPSLILTVTRDNRDLSSMERQFGGRYLHASDWRWRNTQAVFLNALRDRIHNALLMSLVLGYLVVFPLQAVVERIATPEADYAEPAFLYTALFILVHDRAAAWGFLYTLYLWWCGCATREKAIFVATWYVGAAVVPFLAGACFWNFLHSRTLLPGSGVGATLWAWVIELSIVNAVECLTGFLTYTHFNNEYEASTGYDLSLVSREYRNHMRRLYSQAAVSRLFDQPLNDTAFTYEGLSSPTEIRLVQVHHRAPPSVHDVTLVTKPLEEKHLRYTAISYVWGDPRKTRKLRINGKWLSVPASTFEIVQDHMQWWAADADRLFWIDSICINQDDDEEKREQIKLMRRIYSEADEVISYLKPEDPAEADIAVTFFTSLLSDVVDERLRSYNFLHIPYQSVAYRALFFPITRAWLQLGQPLSVAWEALSKLYANKYWTRVWIVPELILAPERKGALRIFYGEHELSWRSLYYFTMLQAMTPWDECVDWGFHDLVTCEPLQMSSWRLKAIFDLRLSYQRLAVKHPGLQLPALLTTCRQLQATNPLDRVFALLSALRDGFHIPPELQPEYITNTVDRLYTDLATFCLRNFNPEWLLAMGGVGYSQERLAAPSWVPNWTQPHPVYAVFSMGDGLAWMRTNRNTSSFETASTGSIVELSGSSLQLQSRKLHAISDSASLDGVFGRMAMKDPAGKAAAECLAIIRGVVELTRRMVKTADIDEATVDALGRAISTGLGRAYAFRSIFNRWARLARINGLLDGFQEQTEVDNFMFDAGVEEFECYASVCDLRAVAVVDDGTGFALVPRLTCQDDEIHAIEGVESTFVLRPVRSAGTRRFELVGDCFISPIRGYTGMGEDPGAAATIELV